MTSFGRDSSESLVACFLGECESRFRFMELQHGFQYFSGLAAYERGRQVIRPYAQDDIIESPFIAVTRYEKDAQVFEITYSEDRFSLECHVMMGNIYRVTLDELLKAAKKAETNVVKLHPTAHPDGLADAIADLSVIVQANSARLLDAGNRTFERALVIREKLMEHTIREQYRKNLDEVRAEAAKAFLHKNFPKVISLFRPYEPDLGPADLKKLEQARRKVLSA